jgi:lipoprotein-releasing system ATP-binding protein
VTVPALEIRGVHKSFSSPGEGAPVPVLRGVDLRVESGESVAIVGPSGAGKSTLLSLVGGLDVPDQGEVLVRGRALAGMSERDRARFRALEVGFVFQLHNLLPQCTVLENVLVPALAARLAGARERAEASTGRARRLIERVGLLPVAGHLPSQLSGGESLRAALVRALVNAPALLLADEPTGSLDEETAREVSRLLVEVNREEGTSLVVVTHSPALAALMDRRLVLRAGVLAP